MSKTLRLATYFLTCNILIIASFGAIHKLRRQLGGGEGSKIIQNCRRIVLKNCRHGGGGVKNSEKLPTLFMDGPL